MPHYRHAMHERYGTISDGSQRDSGFDEMEESRSPPGLGTMRRGELGRAVHQLHRLWDRMQDPNTEEEEDGRRLEKG